MAQTKSIRIYRKAEQTPQYTTDMHIHAQHELYFLIAGTRRYFIGHSIYDVLPGNLVIIPKTELHKTNSAGKLGYDRFVLFFTDEDIPDFIADVGPENYNRLLQGGCLQLPPSQIKQMQTQLERMYDCYQSGQPYEGAILSNALRSLLLCALQWGKKVAPCTGESADKIQQVARYVSENFQQPLSLHEAAQMACMEDTYFSKRFKALTGFGFGDYLTQTRLRHAQRLLRETTLSVGQIAEQCGFSGANYFGDAFRRATGLSPSAYRRNKAPFQDEKG